MLPFWSPPTSLEFPVDRIPRFPNGPPTKEITSPELSSTFLLSFASKRDPTKEPSFEKGEKFIHHPRSPNVDGRPTYNEVRPGSSRVPFETD
jgi:hypothetical protein